MTEKRARTSLSKVRIPYFEREYQPVKPVRSKVRFKTVDDVVFEVCDTSIVPSTYMNQLIYGSRVNRQQPDDITYPLPNVAGDVFEKVMRYCYFHTSKYCDNLRPCEIKEWDDQFMDLDPRQLCELASAAYYLDVKDLIELTCRAIAAIISGKTAEQIRKTFHIENDLAGTIDRVLPNNARRRAREHSPKKTIRNRDNNDSSQEQSQEDVAQENPGAQKTVDELTEWINSSSSKSKKKKKKRHRDKNPAKRGESRENDDDIRSNLPAQSISNESNPQDSPPEDEDPAFELHEPTRGTAETHDDHVPIYRANEQNKSEPISETDTPDNATRQEEPGIEGSIAEDESSSSDVAFVSEKLVNRRVVEQTPSTGHAAGTSNAPSSLRAPNQQATPPNSRMQDPDDASNSAMSDADSVQWVQLTPSAPTPQVKQERNRLEASGSADDSSENSAAVISRKDRSSQVESRERGDVLLPEQGGPSNVKERKSDHVSGHLVKEDATMEDVRDTPAAFPALSDEHVVVERFIDCPENMDREVEAFQQRLNITEPLSSHRCTSRVRNALPPVTESQRMSTLPPSHAVYSSTANGYVTLEERETAMPGRMAGSSSDRGVGNASTAEGAEVAVPSTQKTPANDSSIPREVLTEFLSIDKKIDELKKTAEEIDKETAMLRVRRENIRDDLAVLKIRARELRKKYDIPDQFV